jgi:uncharacterized membrane protein (DUF485 family)
MNTLASASPMKSAAGDLRSIAMRRQRVSLSVTVLLLLSHLTFILLVAFCKQQLSEEVVPGLSIGILAGFATVGLTLLLTVFYVVWVNRVHDASVRQLCMEAEAK